MAETTINNLRVISFNCNSIRSKVDTIREILNKCDILLCQEVMLPEEEVSFVYGLDEKFSCHVVASNLPSHITSSGRPRGGFAVFYRKLLDLRIDIITCHDHYVFMSILIGANSVGIGNIYMPCDDRRFYTVADYQRILGELKADIDSIDTNDILLFGDFNADPHKGRFWQYLSEFTAENDFIIADFRLPFDSFTYFSPSHNTCSWLDHAVLDFFKCTENRNPIPFIIL